MLESTNREPVWVQPEPSMEFLLEQRVQEQAELQEAMRKDKILVCVLYAIAVGVFLMGYFITRSFELTAASVIPAIAGMFVFEKRHSLFPK